MKPVKAIKFGKRKDAIEAENASHLDTAGGVFGLFHKNVTKHYRMYSDLLLNKSPFVCVEMDEEVHKIQLQRAKYLDDDRIVCLHGNLFDVLFKKFKSPSLFSYGHLDFCVTATGLTAAGIHQFIQKLSKWKCLKSTFYLEFSICIRGDSGSSMSLALLEGFVPAMFKQSKWAVEIVSADTYRDLSPMMNVLYKFKRR